MTRNKPIIVVLCTAVAIGIVVAILLSLSTRTGLSDNLAAIEQYLPNLQAALRAEPEFANVEVVPSSAHGGCIEMSGEVAHQEDLNRLRAIVKQSSPPRHVFWFVSVAEN